MSWTTVCDLPMTRYDGDRVTDASRCGNDAIIRGSVERGPGYLRFRSDDDALEVPVRDDSLQRFAALRIQALVRPETITRRYNIVEGWMSFAFLIESDGRLVATVYDGQRWVGPDSGTTTVPANRWSRVAFQHDGVSHAFLTLDGNVVGRSHDMPPVMHQPRQVIAVGHWPRGDGRYTFRGRLGHVRIERRDYEDFWRDAMATAFCQRRLTPRQADAIREIFHLFDGLDTAEKERLRACAAAQSERLRRLLHRLRGRGRRETVRLRQLGDRLREAWCCIADEAAIREALREYFQSISGPPGSEEARFFREVLEEFVDISRMCARQGQPYDRMGELASILLPELRTAEADLRDIAASL